MKPRSLGSILYMLDGPEKERDKPEKEKPVRSTEQRKPMSVKNYKDKATPGHNETGVARF